MYEPSSQRQRQFRWACATVLLLSCSSSSNVNLIYIPYNVMRRVNMFTSFSNVRSRLTIIVFMIHTVQPEGRGACRAAQRPTLQMHDRVYNSPANDCVMALCVRTTSTHAYNTSVRNSDILQLSVSILGSQSTLSH